jgi:hypothetical protein
MNLAGGWASFIASAGAWYLATNQAFVDWLASFPLVMQLHFVVFRDGANIIYLPWGNLFFIVSGIIAGVGVSLLTSPTAQEKLDNFYALIRTPVITGEQVDAPCTLPKGGNKPLVSLLFPNSNFMFFKPSLAGVLGFLAGWGYVALLIGTFYLITKMGT